MKKYNIIYADPPWNEETRLHRFPGRGNDMEKLGLYPLMTPQQLQNLPIPTISATDSLLFLWVISSRIPEAITLMKSWGFRYLTIAFIWVKMGSSGKLSVGLGNWTRNGGEICLIGKKGKPKRVAKNIKQIVISPRSIHSRKPAEVRDKIVALCGDLPRIELFARQKTQGWDVWGDEVESDIQL